MSSAIIVGAEPRVVVTVARSLHRHGVRCVVAVPPGQSLRVDSRAISAAIQLEGSVAEAAALLRLLAQAEHVSWVAATSDVALAIVGHDYDQLSRVCKISSPRPEIVARVLDRSQTLAIAERCGVPVPRSVRVESIDNFDSAIVGLRFPVVAKLGDKGARPYRDFKTRTFTDVSELRHAFASNPDFGAGLLFQQYEPGEDVGVELLMHDGAPIAHFQHRRPSEFPPSGGVAVLAISEPADAKLLAYAVALLRELNWEGVAMVEFRHDAATGAASLMEVNGRFCESIALTVAAGMDFPLYAWQTAQRIRPTVPDRYKHGLVVRWTAGALQRFTNSGDGSTSVGRTRQLLAGFHPRARSALWDWSDPKPGMQEVVGLLTRMLKDGAKARLPIAIPQPVIVAVKSSRSLPPGRRRNYLTRQLTRSMGIASRQQLPAKIKSVLFVCHGNIMRSAAAAQFLRDALHASGVDDINVASAGTTTRAGRLADQRVSAAARQLGTSLDEHRSQPLTRELVQQADVVFAMDDLNVVNIASAFPAARGRVMLFGGMTSSGQYEPIEIIDPYMASAQDVIDTVTRIHEYVAALTQALIARR